MYCRMRRSIHLSVAIHGFFFSVHSMKNKRQSKDIHSHPSSKNRARKTRNEFRRSTIVATLFFSVLFLDAVSIHENGKRKKKPNKTLRCRQSDYYHCGNTIAKAIIFILNIFNISIRLKWAKLSSSIEAFITFTFSIWTCSSLKSIYTTTTTSQSRRIKTVQSDVFHRFKCIPRNNEG